MKLLAKIKNLAPRDFEHLMFDLLMIRGLGNLRWRTPGTDVGRDIEGDFQAQDFSGESRAERWYVECKRHSKTVDWPTVFGKLAYADTHEADYLLVCTTASLSPQCKDEVARHESLRRRPKLRAWEGAHLEAMIGEEPLLLTKYGLLASKRNLELSALPIANVLAKTVHQAYGESATPSAALEFGAATADLVSIRLSTDRTTDESRAFEVDRDGYSWLKVRGKPRGTIWGSHECRMLVTGLRFLTRQVMVDMEFVPSGGGSFLRLTPAPKKTSIVTINLLNALAVWTDWEWQIDKQSLLVRSRKQR